MHKYDKIFKYLLIQIPYIIDENFLLQWYVVGLLQNICSPLRRHEVKTCDEALRFAQQIKIDDEEKSTNSSTLKKLNNNI